jgi:cation diffusion facilitator CzcD-associated flavoprotein CzcO
MTRVDELECELCIVGAGYAALNGLNAAAKYLKPGSRVVVIDKNETWGGQWTRQYDFVRLHQPYRMFTAGDQPWALTRDPSYLATRREVLDHLGSVPAVSVGVSDPVLMSREFLDK